MNCADEVHVGMSQVHVLTGHELDLAGGLTRKEKWKGRKYFGRVLVLVLVLFWLLEIWYIRLIVLLCHGVSRGN